MTLREAAAGATVTATDSVFGSITGTTSDINVDATHLVVATSTDSPTAGSPFNVTVTAKDSGAATVTGYTDTVHFTKTDSGTGSAVPGDYTFTGPDSGTKTFVGGLTLVTTGSQTVTATDTGYSSITGHHDVTVSPAAAVAVTIESAANGSGAHLDAQDVIDGYTQR